MKRIAFTLTELLIALAVLGILTAILMPIIFNIMPDQNALMAKRAYYTVQTIVSDLINDDNCYPDLRNTGEDEDEYIGAFSNGYGYTNCEKWGGNDETSKYISEEGNANIKFITLLTDKLDIKGTLPPIDDETFESTYSNENPYKFKTKDGMEWIIPTEDAHLTEATKDSLTLMIDVNGDEKPNCAQGNSYYNEYYFMPSGCNKREKGFDRFVIEIYQDGRLELNIYDQWAIDAVDGTKSITGEDD